jgi:hypothetical protein
MASCIFTPGEAPGLSAEAAFAGHHNGLCGAAQPGALFLVTGLRQEHVGFRGELHDREPALSDSWTDVVEVSLTTAAERLVLRNNRATPGRCCCPPASTKCGTARSLW